jgi:hypothetical protein
MWYGFVEFVRIKTYFTPSKESKEEKYFSTNTLESESLSALKLFQNLSPTHAGIKAEKNEKISTFFHSGTFAISRKT